MWQSHDYSEFQILSNETFDHGNPSSSPEIQIQNEDYGSQATYLTSLTPDDGGHDGQLGNAGQLVTGGQGGMVSGHLTDTVIQYSQAQYQQVQETKSIDTAVDSAEALQREEQSSKRSIAL